MKASLRFVLPEEQQEFKDSFNGPKWKSVVQDLDNLLRNDIKYQEGKMTPEVMREYLFNTVRDMGLSLDE